MAKNKIKLKIHLVLNAHLDPIWQWEWEEGCLEALATFRQAVRFLKEYPDLVFNHNEALLYQWVEHYDNELFQEIKRLVKIGRWNISGGWYLQPDCNIPSGESFVRQILEGKLYFREKFKKDITIAYNFDAFGHNAGLPQLLKKSGFQAYIHIRPSSKEKRYPSDVYLWEGVDKNRIVCIRQIADSYTTDEGGLLTRINQVMKAISRKKNHRPIMILWGTGNHGGGATYKDLEALKGFIKEHKDVEIIHSTPERYFKALQPFLNNLPKVRGNIHRCFSGCYTSFAKLKKKHAEVENFLLKTEKYASMAALVKEVSYPAKELKEAWRGLLFCQFHDILPGSSIPAGEKEAMDILGKSLEIARQVRLKSQWNLIKDISYKEGEIPVFVFNPNSFPIKMVVDTEFMIGYRPSMEKIFIKITDNNGKLVPSQEEVPSSKLPVEWRKKVAFEAEINPLSIKKFSILQTKKPCEAFNSDLSSIDKADYFELSNSFLKVKISKKSGYISSIFNKQLQKEFVKREAFIPIVIEDQGDAWGTGEDAFRKIVGKFALVRGKNVGEYSSGRREVGKGVRVVEKGDVRIKAEAIFSCNGCCLTAAYTLSRKDPLLRIDYDILWTKKRHMLKISLPLNLTFSSVLAEIPYGAIKLKADGKENVYQRWLLVENKNQGIGLINNGQYAFDAFKNEIRLNILRSAVYCHHNEYIFKKNRTYQTMDMGYHNISFGIITDKAENLRKKVPLFARNFNLTPDALVAFPSNKNKFEIPPFPINIDNNQVVCEAIKKAEDGEGYIARFFEVTGKKCNIRLSFFDKNKFVKFLPFEIKTFRFNKKYVKECKLIEDGLN